jgi:hypothetical protein
MGHTAARGIVYKLLIYKRLNSTKTMKKLFFLLCFLPIGCTAQTLDNGVDLSGNYVITDTNAVRTALISYLNQECIDSTSTPEDIANCIAYNNSQVNFVSIHEQAIVMYDSFDCMYKVYLEGDAGKRDWERYVPLSIVKPYISRNE